MIIKLASLNNQEENWVRNHSQKPDQVKSKSALMNFTHPVVLAGGILGNTAAGVASDRIFNNDALSKAPKTILNRLKDVFPKKQSVLNNALSTSFINKLGPNALRAIGGTVGAGLGALMVKSFSKKEDKQ